ncbi:hypothetical protein REPUB_Repub09cG0148200 [Reevesia pubescens]
MGRYARICVQVSLEKPIPCYVRVEERIQALVYETIRMFCFHYSKLRHKRIFARTLEK